MASDVAEMMSDILQKQGEGIATILGSMLPAAGSSEAEKMVHWAQVAGRVNSIWTDFQVEQLQKAAPPHSHYGDPVRWVGTVEAVLRQLPLASPDVQAGLWNEVLELVNAVAGQYGLGPRATERAEGEPVLPLADRRFADSRWRKQPVFALLHQVYLLLSQHVGGLAESVEGLEPARKAQLVFATQMLLDALSPANFPLTNPVALDTAANTQGDSLVRGFEHFVEDLRKRQLTHTAPGAFVIGENIATTPGKVILETPLYQLIQYTPTTDKVLRTPLVIFPPWINRFYILDLNARKSFVRWAVEQGQTVFMVSWKSADASMAELAWDDYIQAQMDCIDAVCERLAVPATHTIGYCVAGTTLAATLAVMAKKGTAGKVASATFFTAQVDFEEAGDLKNFIDDQQIETIGRLATDGYIDGRYLAATFNILRGNDLIWSTVQKNYLLGEAYPAFDLLHWNGDVTNLPAKWHGNYLRDLYRDNRLVVPDSLQACGEPIDLRRIRTPCYIQAGREDHIAPTHSVWKLTRYLQGPWTFLLAGSGHIAGVVNPPSSAKYGYWTNEGAPQSLAEFQSGAVEHPGSWWPHWIAWIKDIDGQTVSARGKRRPGGRGDRVIEDAPGRYVATR